MSALKSEQASTAKPSVKDSAGSSAFSMSRFSAILYGLVAFLWGPIAGWGLESSLIKTGAVCPVGNTSVPWTFLLQATMSAVDAHILRLVSQVRQREVDKGLDLSHFLRTCFLAAAAIVAIGAFLPILVEFNDLIWILRVQYVEVRDVLLDSCVATILILCGISVSADLHPTTIAVVGTSLGVFGWQIPNLPSSPLLPPLTLDLLYYRVPRTVLFLGLLILMTAIPDAGRHTSTTAFLHKWMRLGYLAVVGLCVFWTALYPMSQVELALPAAVGKLTKIAELDFAQWSKKAHASQTLNEAVAEYERRYGIPPPPKFDKWYEFAQSHKSEVIDSFDQINNDLLPFWAIEPAEIRARTNQLLSEAVLGMGGLRIRGGQVSESPHIPGTHRWMTEALERMIQPYSQWLPDMDFAVNLGDESRVTVPFEEMEALLKQASEARSKLASASRETHTLTSSWTAKGEWGDDWIEPRGDYTAGAHDLRPDFRNNLRKQLYYEWVAPTCPADSPARTTRWWDRSVSCVECLKPHSIFTDEGAVMADASMAVDSLCYQPDLAYLHGFITSPAVVSTRKLVPIFSQARVGGFSDILFPSPWNYNLKSEYEEHEDMSWEDKHNTMFWRGTASDGYTWDRVWTGFLRARFVQESHRYTTHYSELFRDQENPPFGVNVSFIGPIDRCDTADCHAELATFHHWGESVLPYGKEGMRPTPDDGDDQLPAATPFDENWHYKHLMDMDGAGFSGRFLPFLQSRSLVYRAALFKTWFDERVHAWHHYVPVDVRLGHGFWAVVRYLAGDDEEAGSESESGAPHTQKTKGEDVAQQIAQQGRDWAARTLRAEDMQIYMFRLLLEWGRVVDDERENLGYTYQ